MTDAPTIKVVVDKKRLLQDITSIDGLMAEYGRFLQEMGEDGSWEEEALKLIKSHQDFLNRAKVSLRAVDMAGAITRELLKRLGVEKITLKVKAVPPGAGRVQAVPEGSELLQGLEQLVAQINSIAKAAPIAMQPAICRPVTMPPAASTGVSATGRIACRTSGTSTSVETSPQ